ncbi:uncharacterized protein TNCV_2598111 [Trichonephila clavipes]|nr:uncharacterized protein TNCV_2598111 [Trichonephila clavipes]
MEIRIGSSDSNSSRHKSSDFESVQRRSNESQYCRKKRSGVKRDLEENGISFKIDQGERHTGKSDERGQLITSPPGFWSETNRKAKWVGKRLLCISVSLTLGLKEPRGRIERL